MTVKRSNRKVSTVAKLIRQTSDIAMLSPGIASRRLIGLSAQRPWIAAFNLSTMGAEKAAAFSNGWMAMATVAARAQTHFVIQSFSTLWNPSAFKRHQQTARGNAVATSLNMLAGGVKPLHKRVVSNAKKR
jgi:hypothetical protein